MEEPERRKNVLRTTCREGQLLDYTSKGWELEKVINVTDVLPYTETEHVVIPPPPANPNSYSSTTGMAQSVQNTRQMAAQAVVFLLVLNEDSSLATLTKDKESILEREKGLRVELETKRKELLAANGKAVDLTVSIESKAVALDDVRRDRDQLRETNKKLEGDIGKVRSAIGEKQMKEILA